jgi:hypothetical protein
MGREANLSYLARTKVKGVPHHAKAGNINSALLKESEGSGTFVLVLDCDMIVHPDFLQNILGHFYKQVGPHAFLVMMVVAMCAVCRWQMCVGAGLRHDRAPRLPAEHLEPLLQAGNVRHRSVAQYSGPVGHVYHQVKSTFVCFRYLCKGQRHVCACAGLRHDRAPGLPAEHPGPL